MHDSEQEFTLTLIVDGEDSKILISNSDVPADTDEDADGVIYKSDLPDQYDDIVSKIPIFSECEDASKESITHTLDDYNSLYDDLDLMGVIEAGEEILHVDLDGDDESEEEHELGAADPYDIYRDDAPDKDDALAHIDPREALGGSNERPSEDSDFADF